MKLISMEIMNVIDFNAFVQVDHCRFELLGVQFGKALGLPVASF
jgi:hypothetical protein